MEAKDIISGLAFVLSIGATVISLVRSKYEKQRAIKAQLTEVLSDIVKNQLEAAKLQKEAAQDPAYVQGATAALGQQHGFLMQQAMYLVEQIPTLATAFELNTIALSNAQAGDLILADRYYLRAIDACPSDYYRALATRSYAAFIFMQRRLEEGRDYFNKALKLLKGGDSLIRYARGLTYQVWAFHEAVSGAAPTRVDELFASAEAEFKGVDNELARNKALQALHSARHRPQGTPTTLGFSPDPMVSSGPNVGPA